MIDPKKIVLIPLFCLISFMTSARDIYVAKTGDDANPGTLESPYLTIEKAAAEAVAGDTVYIREGTYEEILAPSHSGVAGNPIVFQSYPGEKVIITAMQALSGWVLDEGAIYKTTVDWSLEQKNFVMNDKTVCDLARWPNNTDGNPFTQNALINTAGSNGDVIFDAYLDYDSGIPDVNWQNGGSIYFYGGGGWTTWRSFIKSSTATRVSFDLDKNPSWIRTEHSPGTIGDFFLQGVKGALDFQNEWYFDPDTNELFIQLPNGEAPVDGLVKMRRREITVDLRNRDYIQIKNLAVFGGAIEINGDHNTIEGISSFYGNYTLGVVTGFEANSRSVNISGNHNTIKKCEIAFGSGTGVWDSGNNSQILNNYIHDFNFLGDYDAVVMIRNGSNTTLKNNTIRRGGRDAIQAFNENSEIAYNDISYSNLIADDCGLFYTVGGPHHIEIHHNWFHDAYAVEGKYKAAGIYLDNDAEAFQVHHNVVWNTDWTAVQINWDGTDIDIFNNTFFNNSKVMGAWHKEGTSFSNVKVWNNLGGDANWEPQSDKQNNLVVAAGVFTNAADGNFRLKLGSAPIDAGRVIDGFTDGYVGTTPDIGAYENGGDDWVAGINWNTKLGPTGLGCYGLPGEDCIPLPENDADFDGVSDANDLCPDTPLDATVNSNGCLIFTLAADNFSLLSTGESCKDSKDGSIAITAVADYNYTAVIEGYASKNFVTHTSFDMLAAGTYDVCISVEEAPDYEQCFTIVIKAPEEVTVFSKTDASKREVTLHLTGGELYRIVLNDKVMVTDKEAISLKLKNGKNNLKVSTDLPCQGMYEENIMMGQEVLIFPNPVTDQLHVTVPDSSDKNISWALFSPQGKRIMQHTEKTTHQNIKIDLSSVESGYYLLKINTPDTAIHKKIIKF